MSDTNQDGSFADFVASDRERLTGDRRAFTAWRDEVIEEANQKLDAIDREFAALDAYEAAKAGAPPPQNTARTTRARRGSRREELLNLIRGGDGLSRGEILERLGLKGDKAGEMSVSNALTALKKRGDVRHEGGLYYAPEAVPQEEWPTQEQSVALAEAAE